MISACGGNGYAGGGGGRVSVEVFSRHDEPTIYVHGEVLCFCITKRAHRCQVIMQFELSENCISSN